MRTISTLIIKPTKGCNADCSYCSAPPDGAPKWSIDDFRRVFDALEPKLQPTATFIWHGGEPMLLGTAFYEEALALARARLPKIRFSMQSNLLAYNHRWNAVFDSVFQGSISTSWDPDGRHRTIQGDAATYERVYQNRMGKVLADGWRPKVISTFDETSAPLMDRVYDLALASADAGTPHDIRLNYRYPAGRAWGEGETLTPRTYGQMLLHIYERWMEDAPPFAITPLDQMFHKVTGAELHRCPWSKACTGRIVGIEPNFDVYNCGEFADLADPTFRFGNLLTDGIAACLASPAARMLAMRTHKIPASCSTCIHFQECEGGCMRDAVLYDHGLYGKFHYCESWQEVFSRIKESILTGEADRLLRRFGHDPEAMRATVRSRLAHGLAQGQTHMRRPVLALGHLPTYPEAHNPLVGAA